MTTEAELRAVLWDACVRVGIDPVGAQPVRLGENAIFRFPGQVIARVARLGQFAAAAREVWIARWLASHGVPVVRVLDGFDQPVESGGRAVTFWEELPAHRHGTPAQVADVLCRLHALPVPARSPLAPLAPFVRLAERIDSATTLTAAERHWLRERLAHLRERYARLPAGLPHRVVHGDIWVGNAVSTQDGRVVLLDLERCAVGPPEWDLVSIAVKRTSFGWITDEDYREFCRRMGCDVTTWEGFELLRDIRELRMTCYFAQYAAEDPAVRGEAKLRLGCIRGDHGPRPWRWTPAPG